jgi:hypothetical protein
MEPERFQPEQRKRDLRARLGLLAGVVALSLAGLVAFHITRHAPPIGFSIPAARLELSPSRLDLGDGKPNELLHGNVRLRDAGHGVLEFEITASCGCTDLTPRQGSIPAGAEQDVRLVVRLPDYANSERAVQLSVKTNNPRSRSRSVRSWRNAPRRSASRSRTANTAGCAPGCPTRRSRSSRNSPASSGSPPAGGLEFGDQHGTLELFLEGSEKRVIRVPLRVQVPPPLSVTRPHSRCAGTRRGDSLRCTGSWPAIPGPPRRAK